MHNDLLFDDALRFLEVYESEKAEGILVELLASEPNNVKYMNKLGVALIQRKMLFEAENWFRKAIEINPNYAPVIVNLGNLCLEVDDLDRAMQYYEEAARKDVDYPETYYNMAIVFKKRKDYNKYTSHMKKYKRLLRRAHADNENHVRILAKRRLGCLPATLMVAVGILFLVLLIQ